MGSRVGKLILALLVVGPTVASAQTSARETRAQARREVVELEGVGYEPSRIGNTSYPDDIQAAEKRVIAQKLAQSRRVMAGTRK